MQTQCPQCSTVFNITQQHLNMADGRVRCNQCQTVFDGYENMLEENNPPQLEDVATASPETSPTAKGNRTDIKPDAQRTPNTLIYSELLEDDYNKPRFSQIISRITFSLLSLVLLIALLLQLAYLKRVELAEHPTLSEYIHKACNAFDPCNIPIKRALDQFQLETRNVYAHPNIPKALVVSATFRNSANFAQPYPTLIISMSNVRGQEVAARHFKPEEYLDKFTTPGIKIQPGQSTSISLQLADPGNDAMAFEIDFQ